MPANSQQPRRYTPHRCERPVRARSGPFLGLVHADGVSFGEPLLSDVVPGLGVSDFSSWTGDSSVSV